MSDKPSIAIEGLPQSVRDLLSKADQDVVIQVRGIGNKALLEPVPEFISAECEKVISGKNNTSLVLGRDRPAGRLSGYGGRGDTQAGAIDIVAGRMGYQAKSDVYVDPNFKTDAARIYVSQKADIDRYLGLTRGVVGNSKAKSAVALKADGIRLVGREGIKIVTGTDKKNSQGGDVKAVSGIDLIAGNDGDKLQPLVKGDNNAEALNRLVEHVDKLNGIVDSFLTHQMKFNDKLTHHYHLSPFYGMSTSPSYAVAQAGVKCMTDLLQDTKMSLVSHKTNLVMFTNNYLSPAGSKYINSRYNNVN